MKGNFLDRNSSDREAKEKSEDIEKSENIEDSEGFEDDDEPINEFDLYEYEMAMAYAPPEENVWGRRIIRIVALVIMIAFAVFMMNEYGSTPPITDNPQFEAPDKDILAIELINGEGLIVSQAIVDYLKVDLLDEKNADVMPYEFLTKTERLDSQVPVGIKLSTTTKTAGAIYYKIELSDNTDFENATVGYIYALDGTYEFEHLYANTQYYYRVTVYTSNGEDSETGSFTTADVPRILSIDGLYNVRDIGNWKTDSGKRIRQGLLLRGTEMDGAVESQYHLTTEGLLDMLEVFGIRTDMDLRSQTPESMDALGSRVEHKYYAAVMYEAIFTESGKERVREVFDDLADPENYPVYLHCTYGCDRTGTVCYLLEALLGVSAEDCLTEYGLSNLKIANIKLVEKGLAAYDGVTLKEKTETYLLSCGVTAEQIESIRNIFLED